MTNIINLTGRAITILDEYTRVHDVLLPWPGHVQFVSRMSPAPEQFITHGDIQIPVRNFEYVGIQSGFGILPPAEGVVYVVNREDALAAKRTKRSTDDLLVPNQPVRDHEGNIVGYLSLARIIGDEADNTLEQQPSMAGSRS
jgi:hypothetical protein